MSKTVPVIGVEVEELCWLRMLVALLRHPDPAVPELARQAMIYLTDAVCKEDRARRDPLDHTG